MKTPFDENPTRQLILTLLKKNGPLTVSELGREMDITHMAIRQHLLYLERKGNIQYEIKKFGVGRPVFQYSLTDKADNIFPKAYDDFAADVLAVIEDIDGKKKLEKIFKARNDLLLEKYGKALSKGKSIFDKTAILADLLDAEGAMVDLQKENGSMRLSEHNCLLQRVADRYPTICDYELELYRGLLGKGVVRRKCMTDGAPSCEYVIPKA
jgi:predicted ArsR family transcriptional regulator